MSDIGMTNSVTEIMSQEVPCPDPECGGRAFPEQDGDHIYYECEDCGFNFGYERAPQPAVTGDAQGACSIGVPESIRRAASKHMENAMAGLDDLQPLPAETPVSLTKKRA